MEIQRITDIDDIVRFINTVFDEAIEKKASDIHIEPQKNHIKIRFRIDGDLFVFYEVNNFHKENLLTRIKIQAHMRIDESRIPQDGNIMYPYKDEDIDMRISTFPTQYGEKIVIRILVKNMGLLNIDKLGFLNVNSKIIKKALNIKEGLILVSGPTGSGKTTTLYAMLNLFDPAKFNISTLEDPIEYKIENLNQSQVKPDIGYTFSYGLRTLLRQDPDIILVGEIRDKETAVLAIEASLTGHLVLCTIHATKGIGVVERLINMGIEPYLLASSLKLIIAQRLVKKLCNCALNYQVSDEDSRLLESDLGPIWHSIKNSLKSKKIGACDKCFQSGYSGRIGIHEVILLDSDFNKFILSDLNYNQWENLMFSKGFINLYQDGLIKFCGGLTDINQILPYK